MGNMKKIVMDKAGYKSSTLGKIPSDWEVTTFGAVCEKLIDGTHFSPQSKEGPFKYVTSKNIRNHGLELENISYVSAAEHREIYKRCPVKFGDILLTKDGASTGACCKNTLDEEFSLLSSVAVLRTNEQKMRADYLLHFIKSPMGQKIIEDEISGQAITRITLEKIRAFRIITAPLREQNSIASLLSTWDKAIEKTTLLITAKKQRKKWLMDQLLTGKKRLNGFNSVWGEVSLAETGDIVSGGTPSTTNESYWNGNINWCTPTDITKLNGEIFIGETVRKISDAGFKNSSANLLPINSVIVCTRATVGACAINKVPMTTNQGFKSIVPKHVHFLFLYYKLLTLKSELLSLANGSTFLEISKSDFEDISIKTPSFAEQVAISNALQTADKEINLLKQKLEGYKEQKKGLMQVLLTGKKRLKL